MNHEQIIPYSPKIDTDMTAAYLRAVQQECEHANETIKGLEKFAIDLSNSLNTANAAFDRQSKRVAELEAEVGKLNTECATLENLLKKYESSSMEWHPSTETPPDDTRCIVRTQSGETYFLSPINGKWMERVVKWMYIPQ